jgi:hypothetical protein
MTDRELFKMALDALENAHANEPIWKTPIKEAIEALRFRLAQPEPEPVAWFMEGTYKDGTPSFVQVNGETDPEFYVPLYTAPPQRKDDHVWCGCGDQIMPDDDEAMCGTCIAFGKNVPPQREWMEQERAVGYREGHQAALKQREWVGLTHKERCELWNIASKFSPDAVIMHDYAREIEAKLKEKNT